MVSHNILLCKLKRNGFNEWTVGWTRRWLHNPEGSGHWLRVPMDTSSKRCPSWVLIGTVLFNIFNNGIEKGIRCSLNKFPDVTNISGVIGTSGGWNNVQRDLDKLEK